MDINEEYNQMLNSIYKDGRISEGEANKLSELNNAANVEKKVGERAETVLLMAEVLDDVYQFLDGSIQEDIDEVRESIQDLEYFDWDGREVNKNEIEKYISDTVKSGRDVTDEGYEMLIQLDRVYEQGVVTFNNSVEYIEEQLDEDIEDITDFPVDEADSPEIESSPQPEPDTDETVTGEPELEGDEALEDRDVITIHSPEGLIEKIGSVFLGEKNVRGQYTEGDTNE